jgi:hypothetical protein
MPDTTELYEEICFDIDVTGTATIFIDGYAWYAYVIDSLACRTDTGTCTLDAYINTTVITGLSTLSITSSISTNNATAANSVSIADYVKLVTSSVSGASRLIGSLKLHRT